MFLDALVRVVLGDLVCHVRGWFVLLVVGALVLVDLLVCCAVLGGLGWLMILDLWFM